MKRLFFIILIFINLPAIASTNPKASPSQQQKNILTTFTQSILKHSSSPWGVSAFSAVAQCKNNTPITVFGGTYTNKGKKHINANSIFQIGSITKSFISVVILQLIEEHKLNLSDKAASYFPNYPKWGQITIRQLLNMTSGIPDTDGGDHNIFSHFTAREYYNDLTPTKILNLVYKLPVNFKPGTRYQYSNPNYMLLGLLIKKVTHHSAAYEIKKRIIDKLHLSHTYYIHNTIQTTPGLNPNQVVHGYSYWPRHIGYDPYPFQKFGEDVFYLSLAHFNYADAIISTPTDINYYIHALFTPGRLLNKASVNKFTTLISTKTGQAYTPEKNPGVMGYGLGVLGLFDKQLNLMIYFYQGQTNGFQFIYLYNPSTQQYLTFGINTISKVINKKNSFALFYKLNALCKHANSTSLA